MNEWFCFAALFESCAVIFLAHYEDERMLPRWLLKLLSRKERVRVATEKRTACSEGTARPPSDVADATTPPYANPLPSGSVSRCGSRSSR